MAPIPSAAHASPSMHDDRRWTEVDEYASRLLGSSDPSLDAVLRRSEESGLPKIQVSECHGRFLEILVRTIGATRVLEVGTLGGFSTIFLARGVAEGGVVVSLEVDPSYATVARRNIAEVGVDERVEVIEGDAHVTLATMVKDGVAPFDFVFLDAEKSGYPDYFRKITPLLRPGSMIVADNVVRRGAVLEAESTDPNVVGVRSFTELVASNKNVSATMLQTVGTKGYDGFLIAVVQ